jgi:hypothetical protein
MIAGCNTNRSPLPASSFELRKEQSRVTSPGGLVDAVVVQANIGALEPYQLELFVVEHGKGYETSYAGPTLRIERSKQPGGPMESNSNG